MAKKMHRRMVQHSMASFEVDGKMVRMMVYVEGAVSAEAMRSEAVVKQVRDRAESESAEVKFVRF